jgi:predicted nucleic acid-binding protein
MPVKVVDTSVIAAMFFDEPKAAEAVALVAESDLHAPILLAYELARVAQKKSELIPGKREVIAQALETALATDITWRDVSHPAVLRLALDTKLTTYDASYLYLSRSLGVELVTFDRKLARIAGTAI